MAKLKNIFLLCLRVCVSILLLFLLFKFNRIDGGQLIANIKNTNKFFLLAGFCSLLLSYLLGFLRWRMLLKAISLKISLKRLICSFSGGVFFSIFLPSTIGGDLVRTADLSGHTQKTKEVIATVFLDRLSGYVGLVFVVLLALSLGGGLVLDRVVLTSVAGIIAVLTLVLLVLFNRTIYQLISRLLSSGKAGKIREAVKNIHQEIHLFRNRKRMIAANLLLSFMIQLFSPISAYFIGLALGVKISFIYFLVFLPIIGAITLLPIAIGGSGLREWLYVVYFAKAGVTEHLAVAMSLLSFSFTVVYAAIGGLLYVFTVHRRRLQSNPPPGI